MITDAEIAEAPRLYERFEFDANSARQWVTLAYNIWPKLVTRCASSVSEAVRRAAEKILRMHSDGITDATWDKEVAVAASIIEAELTKD